MEKKHFLSHANALRGLAILLVFIYHLQPSLCPQGFLGVEVFFVLSGYFLIPSLFEKVESGRFSWLKYYKDKGQRIANPLYVMLLLALVAAVPFMIAPDLYMAASTARSAAVGLSNIYLGLITIDYFAPGVQENLYLHTWYISVLIQVLIITPVICVPLAALGRPWRYAVLSICILASFLIFYQQWLPQTWQNHFPSFLRNGGVLGSLYYMTSGRLWEILSGALVLTLPKTSSRLCRNFLLSLGLSMIILPAFWSENYSGFSICAVVGTMLVIRYGENTGIDGLFQNRLFLYLGTVSYSLYLVHWPVIAMANYILMRPFSAFDCLWVSLLCVALTLIMYYFIERKRLNLFVTSILLVAIWVSAIIIRNTNGMEGRIHPEGDRISICTSQDYQNWTFAKTTSWIEQCPTILNPVGGHYGGTSPRTTNSQSGGKAVLQIGDEDITPNFILLGDSYANALFPGLDIIGKKEHWSGLYLNSYVVPIWDKLNTSAQRDISLQFTEQKADALMNWLRKNDEIKFVLINQCWWSRFSKLTQTRWNGEIISGPDAFEHAKNGLRIFCEKIKRMGKTPILVLPTPESSVVGQTNIGHLQKRYMITHGQLPPRGTYSTTEQQYAELNGDIIDYFLELQNQGLCILIDPTRGLFKDGVFDPVQGENLIVYDHGHLSVYGSVKVAELLKQSLTAILCSKLIDTAEQK